MLLEVSQRQMDPDITVLDLKGRITLGRESQRLETLVNELKDKGVKKMIFDMSGVTYVDSAGLGILTYAYATMKKANAELRLAGLQERVQELLKFTHLDTILPVDASLADSARTLASGQAATSPN